MVISNQKNQKSAACPDHNLWTAPKQALDAPDYMHQLLPCHINRIDSSHKKID